MLNDDVPLSVLGNSLKCPKDKEFSKIIRQDLSGDTIILSMECPKCGQKFSNKYTIPQYTRMAEMALIDPPEIKDFQKKMVIFNGVLPKFEKGLDGAFYVSQNAKKETLIAGKSLLCKCNRFYSLTIKNFKKDTIIFQAYCPVCTPKGKKVKLKVQSAALLGKAGVIEPDLMQKIREHYVDDQEMFNTNETYRGNDGTLSTWAQEALGMRGESTTKKCYICGESVSEGMSRCPKCGSDLDL